MHKNRCRIKAMKKIEEVTCIKFQEKSETYHQELVPYNNARSLDNELSMIIYHYFALKYLLESIVIVHF